jgi:hypothetical protein
VVRGLTKVPELVLDAEAMKRRVDLLVRSAPLPAPSLDQFDEPEHRDRVSRHEAAFLGRRKHPGSDHLDLVAKSFQRKDGWHDGVAGMRDFRHRPILPWPTDIRTCRSGCAMIYMWDRSR